MGRLIDDIGTETKARDSQGLLASESGVVGGRGGSS
jgi:hypothetical protein